MKRRDLRLGEFDAQEGCFAARKLLLKSYDMIGELAGDLRSLTNDLNASTALIAPNSVGANCEKLLSYQRVIEGRLLDCIKRKLTERDSLDVFHTLPPRSLGFDMSSLGWGLLSLLILLTTSWSWMG